MKNENNKNNNPNLIPIGEWFGFVIYQREGEGKTMGKLLTIILLFVFLFTTISPTYGTETTEATTPTNIPLSEIGNKIDELVANYIYEFTPGLAVAVVKDGKVIFSRGYGYANIEQQIPVDPATTIFSHASIGKLFVYVSVMQLVEQGLLDLDKDIHVYLPADAVRQFNFEKTFTMRDLLNHSAGFGEIVFNGNQDAEAVNNRRTLREGLLAVQPNQIYTPGTAKAYSNFGIALAAYVVSHISGMEFAGFEQTNILEPLGMTNTKNQPHWFGNSTFMQNRARGYQPDSSGGFNGVHWVYSPIYPAGSLAGTVNDLAQFAIALMPPPEETSPLFNSRSTLDLMLSPSYANPRILRGTNHGFLTYAANYPTLGHGGNLPGFNTEFVIVPSQRFGVIVLSNAEGGPRGADMLIDKIFDLTIGNSMDVILSPSENLPNAASVAGSFLHLRRPEGNIMEAANIMYRNWRVDAIDENTITLTWVIPMGMGPQSVITYQQVEPYLFRAISATDSVRGLARGMYELYFIMENDKPIKISTSWIMDATIQTFGQSMTAFMGGMTILAISTIFFLLASIAIFIRFLYMREEESNLFTRLSNGLLVCGLLFSINWIAFDIRYFTVTTRIFPTTFATPHIWFNYILLFASVVLLAASLIFWKKDRVTVKDRILYFLTVIFIALSLFVLWQWNYFVMM